MFVQKGHKGDGPVRTNSRKPVAVARLLAAALAGALVVGLSGKVAIGYGGDSVDTSEIMKKAFRDGRISPQQAEQEISRDVSRVNTYYDQFQKDYDAYIRGIDENARKTGGKVAPLPFYNWVELEIKARGLD